MPKRLVVSTLIVLIIGVFSTVAAQTEPLNVVATTTLIADVAKNVGGDWVNVSSLIPAGSDVHAFEPTPQDVLKVADANVVLVNGAGLEVFLGDLVENAADVPIITVSNGIEMLAFGEHHHNEEAVEAEHEDMEIIGILGEEDVCEDEHHDEPEATEEAHDEHEHGVCDPHVWTNPLNVKVWATNIAEAFAAADPANADVYRANAEADNAQLDALDAEVVEILSVVPEERRILVTNHEFFGYFAAHYGFEIVGVVIAGGTTLSDTDPQQLAELIQLIADEGVPAIFAEISSTPGLAEVVAQETGINVVTQLYSDSLSSGEPAGTYLDYLRYNALAIAEALK
ncbi:MAG: metal ABC transporter substrate-binding protein [Anaerolineae bacterium]|nr:metal ABC transporter substrate-binding protein [Anaerolineae bacterium]